jgi:hypothetical protein
LYVCEEDAVKLTETQAKKVHFDVGSSMAGKGPRIWLELTRRTKAQQPQRAIRTET